jgi:hypothetical protein
MNGHKNEETKLNAHEYSEMNARTVLAPRHQPMHSRELDKNLSIRELILIMDVRNNKLHIHNINLTAPICQFSALLEFTNRNTVTYKLI